MMTYRKLIFRGLTYHWREYAGVFAGTALSAAILSGALMVGDSVRYSLARLTSERLGNTGFAVSSGERFFTTQLVDDVGSRLKVGAAPVLRLNGLAARPDGRAAANDVQVLGVDARLWALSPEPVSGAVGPTSVWLNSRLAEQLKVGEGDPVVLRIDNPGRIPGDAPLARESDRRVALRLTVSRVLAPHEFGNLSLRAEQIPPMNAFVSLSVLARAVDADGKANLMLIEDAPGARADDIARAIRRHWTLSDAGLRVEALNSGAWELRSDRVFIDEVVGRAAASAVPGATRILSYFVNGMESSSNSTPYSFVCAPGEPLVPTDMADDEMVLNDWTASDLAVGAGDHVTLRYYVMGLRHQLKEESRGFRVRSVVALEGAAADPALMPMFPGLSDVENCREWDPGVTLDLSRIRDKDEAYWQQHHGTPKGFVTLRAARDMWANRFGSLTAVRFPSGSGSPTNLEPKILAQLSPDSLGLNVTAARQSGFTASSKGVDFGQLFLGLSFFLIAASLMLTGLLFTFSVERRAEEAGLLLALGFSGGWVRRLRMAEGCALAMPASLIGVAAGVGYNGLLIRGLRTVWRDVVGTSQLYAHLQASTAAVGWLGGSLAAIVAMGIALHRQTTAPISAVQRGDYDADAAGERGRYRWSLAVAVASLGAALLIALRVEPGRGREAAGAFFSAGALTLIGGMVLCRYLMGHMASGSASGLNRWRLVVRGAARRPGRSLTTIGVLAAGVFLVLSVGANRYGPLDDATTRASGTGGFAFFARSALPVLSDLNDETQRREISTDADASASVSFVQMRLREGDDASCLNLNRVSSPPLLGVDPTELDRRGAFGVATMTGDVDPDHPWTVLEKRLPDGAVPAIADQTVIVWGLGKSVGDTLLVTDGRGQPMTLKLCAGLANSILQGHVLISERYFTEHFPDESGTRVFLIDAPESSDRLAGELSRRFRDWGFELTAAHHRLESFGAVENMYLAIFLVLGGLGLGLGSMGLGIVVWRNVNERRRELAMLRAVGFSRATVSFLVMIEHLVLLVAGLVCGAAASLLAVAPALAAPEANVSTAALVWPLAAILVIGTLWILLATVLSTRGAVLPALRNE